MSIFSSFGLLPALSSPVNSVSTLIVYVPSGPPSQVHSNVELFFDSSVSIVWVSL